MFVWKYIKFSYIHNIQMAFLFIFSAVNKIKAGKLNVMQALVEVMLLHKADPKVAANASGALWNITINGDVIMTICRFIIIFFFESLNAWLILNQTSYVCIEIYKFSYLGYIQLALLLYFSDHNKKAAGQLNVMQALVEVMLDPPKVFADLLCPIFAERHLLYILFQLYRGFINVSKNCGESLLFIVSHSLLLILVH